MTKGEFKEMIETIIEQKLLELLGAPDEGLPIIRSVGHRLLRQKQMEERAATEVKVIECGVAVKINQRDYCQNPF